MIRLLRLLVILYVAVVLQTTLAPAIEILGVRPDFTILIVVLVALYEGAAGGALCGFAAGLFVDASSAQALGITSLANSVLAFGTGSVADRLVRDSFATRALVVLGVCTVRDLCVYILLPSVGVGETFRLLVMEAVPGGIYTALLGPPLMALGERAIRWGPETSRGYR